MSGNPVRAVGSIEGCLIRVSIIFKTVIISVREDVDFSSIEVCVAIKYQL